MHRLGLPILVVLLGLTLVLEAEGGRRRGPKRDQPVEGTTPPASEGGAPTFDQLFATQPPLDVGSTPEGLPSLSAQGCAGCHPSAHTTWAQSPHASTPSPAFEAAVAHAGTPACASCHRPLLQQWPELVAADGGDPKSPVTSPNPAWSPTLQAEGVTCAACHVREGRVIAAGPSGPAPHPTAWTEDLRSDRFCATCHQLTWPGADQPLYDTWGEHNRSAYAAAGVGCVDCHMGAGVERAAPNHDVQRMTGRGLSVLVGLPSPVLTRGQDPLPLTLTVQNTGAGHAVPTGSPFQGVQLRVQLVGPAEADEAPPVEGVAVLAHFTRTLTDTAPWATTADTRLQAGETRKLQHALSLPLDAPRGAWALHVHLERTVRGAVVGEPVLSQVVPLRVD